jgi:hypothetical protein
MPDDTALVPLRRTHAAERDLEWLPPSFKVLRWTVAGAIWTGLLGAVVATAVLAKGVALWLYGKGLVAVVMGGLYAGDRSARALLRLRLRRLARGAVDLSRLSGEADGELLHVRGRVLADRTVPALLSPGEGVYRRIELSIDEVAMVHEEAVDFWLVDESGERVRVEVAGARLLVPRPPRSNYDGDSSTAHRLMEVVLSSPTWHARNRFDRRMRRLEQGKRVTPIVAGEVMLRDGDEIELVGWKSRMVDPTVSHRLGRETPLRTTMRGGHRLPLLLTPARA